MSNVGRVLTMMVLAAASLAVGCVGFHGPANLQRDLARSAGVKLDREFGLTVRRSGMWLARLGMRFADDEDLPSLKGVRRVQVGVYRVEGLRRGVEEPGRIEAAHFPEWEPIVRVHEDGEDVLVLTKLDEGRIRGLLVVVAEQDEWVVIRVKGKLERVIEDAMAMAFDTADRPDLYARSREERGLDPVEPVAEQQAGMQDAAEVDVETEAGPDSDDALRVSATPD